jgi:vesicle-associated membrane protein 7
MAILYALVARSTAVLAEHSAAATNAGAVARQVLERLPDGGADCHVSYTQDRYVFHAKRTDGITALCMADDAAGRKNSPLRTVPPCFTGPVHGLLYFEFDWGAAGGSWRGGKGFRGRGGGA